MADTLYATAVDGQLVRIDLASGSFASRDVRRLADRDNGRLLVPAQGGVLLAANWGPVDSYLVPDDGPIRALGEVALVGTRSGDVVWQIREDDQGRLGGAEPFEERCSLDESGPKGRRHEPALEQRAQG
jgi:hypothetical protein